MENRKILAIDIGGTNTRAALFDGDDILETFVTKTLPNEHATVTLDKIDEFIKRAILTGVKSIGLVCPGPMDYEKGVFMNPPNLLAWANFDIATYFKDKYDIMPVMGNDANLAALAAFSDNRTESHSCAYATISTGFGLGLIINGEMVTGVNGAAAEIAALPINLLAKGNVPVEAEKLASGSGIYKVAKDAGLDAKDTSDVFAMYETNATAKEIIDNSIATASASLACIVQITDPLNVYIGGSVVRHNKFYFDQVSANIIKLCPYQKVIINIIEDDNICLIGAKELARREYGKNN